MTDAEHLHKNNITRTEIMTQFLAHDVDVVVLNATTLTVLGHQLPFMNMLNELRALLALKEWELRRRKPDRLPRDFCLDLRCILMSCNFETTKRRIEVRRQGENKSGGLLDLNEFEKGRRGFEPPALYP